jgi:GNAT superfamily N-acetyltransferase
MTSLPKLTLETPEPDTLKAIGDGLIGFNRAAGHGLDRDEFLVVARDDAGALVGGGWCHTGDGVLFIRWLWVHQDWRGGTGSRLMDLAEAEGVRRGCALAHLDTFTFQARAFYEKRGYEVFGVLDYPKGEVRRFYMKKALAPA